MKYVTRKSNAEIQMNANEDSKLQRGGCGWDGWRQINLFNWRVVALFGPCSWIQSADRWWEGNGRPITGNLALQLGRPQQYQSLGRTGHVQHGNHLLPNCSLAGKGLAQKKGCKENIVIVELWTLCWSVVMRVSAFQSDNKTRPGGKKGVGGTSLTSKRVWKGDVGLREGVTETSQSVPCDFGAHISKPAISTQKGCNCPSGSVSLSARPYLCLGIQGKQASRSAKLESAQAIDRPFLTELFKHPTPWEPGCTQNTTAGVLSSICPKMRMLYMFALQIDVTMLFFVQKTFIKTKIQRSHVLSSCSVSSHDTEADISGHH